MERWDVGLNNNSFDGAGITRDCQEAICELIWNGYEAQATRIDVVLQGGSQSFYGAEIRHPYVAQLPAEDLVALYVARVQRVRQRGESHRT